MLRKKCLPYFTFLVAISLEVFLAEGSHKNFHAPHRLHKRPLREYENDDEPKYGKSDDWVSPMRKSIDAPTMHDKSEDQDDKRWEIRQNHGDKEFPEVREKLLSHRGHQSDVLHDEEDDPQTKRDKKPELTEKIRKLQFQLAAARWLARKKHMRTHSSPRAHTTMMGEKFVKPSVQVERKHENLLSEQEEIPDNTERKQPLLFSKSLEQNLPRRDNNLVLGLSHLTPTLSQNSDKHDKGGLMDDEQHEQHSVYVNHVNRMDNLNPHPKPIIQYSEDLRNDNTIRHNEERPIQEKKFEPVINFAPGISEKNIPEVENKPPSSASVVRKIVEPGRSDPMKNWMNFRLLVDDSGALNIMVAPPNGTHKSTIRPTNSKARSAEGRREAYSDSEYMNRLPPVASFRSPEGNARRNWRHRMPTPFYHNRFFERPDFNRPFWQREAERRQPRLLSDVSTTISDRRHSEEDRYQIKSVDGTGTSGSSSIPKDVIIDDPFVSGCPVRQCADVCPGGLRKLSIADGCPTCECCSAVTCKMACKFGFEADEHACPVCKCLDK